ncbi:hypothetical protein DFH08DRAFT_760404 [Mycena albidolilacea]|uniref:Uncharacterized protein n=1 Tax=Mycena albidolilacea TaxID=1033008 RepID=A0AAD6YXG7_9AGAR|nr:hypothetical protein DFH08DRAFT_760647 [Mycena albidolilacea]KAJ7300496.1 hypothetical protein DFH08DRAFT_760633 [Mycena albidolilacea]KAJ7300968.1 hypothetical protein DFH08DRAFT_760404 [Mycena albidolilacea]
MSRTTANADHKDTALPPKRQGPLIKPVDKPLASTRLNRLIYLLLLLSTLLSAYYGYRVVQWKTDVGGWWNLALGRRPPDKVRRQRAARLEKITTHKREEEKASSETVEERINALADALGMPSRDLASAIAGAVRQHVPPASLSSVAAHQTGAAVDELLREKTDEEKQREELKRTRKRAAGSWMGSRAGWEASWGWMSRRCGVWFWILDSQMHQRNVISRKLNAYFQIDLL